MTKENIIRMAQQSGWEVPLTGDECDKLLQRLERFTALAIAAEREACAQVCEQKSMVKGGEVFAARIRARGAA